MRRKRSLPSVGEIGDEGDNDEPDILPILDDEPELQEKTVDNENMSEAEEEDQQAHQDEYSLEASVGDKVDETLAEADRAEEAAYEDYGQDKPSYDTSVEMDEELAEADSQEEGIDEDDEQDGELRNDTSVLMDESADVDPEEEAVDEDGGQVGEPSQDTSVDMDEETGPEDELEESHSVFFISKAEEATDEDQSQAEEPSYDTSVEMDGNGRDEERSESHSVPFEYESSGYLVMRHASAAPFNDVEGIEDPGRSSSFLRELSVEEEEELDAETIDRELSCEPDLDLKRHMFAGMPTPSKLSGRSLSMSPGPSLTTEQKPVKEYTSVEAAVEGDNSSGDESDAIQEGVVTISSSDPLAAARAAAILKLVSLYCIQYSRLWLTSWHHSMTMTVSQRLNSSTDIRPQDPDSTSSGVRVLSSQALEKTHRCLPKSIDEQRLEE